MVKNSRWRKFWRFSIIVTWAVLNFFHKIMHGTVCHCEYWNNDEVRFHTRSNYFKQSALNSVSRQIIRTLNIYKSVAMQSPFFPIFSFSLSLLSSANKWIHFVCTLWTPPISPTGICTEYRNLSAPSLPRRFTVQKYLCQSLEQFSCNSISGRSISYFLDLFEDGWLNRYFIHNRKINV